MVMLDVLRLLIAVIVAFFAGKLISRLRLPSILGWLITGMVLGPHALGLLNNNVLDSGWVVTHKKHKNKGRFRC